MMYFLANYDSGKTELELLVLDENDYIVGREPPQRYHGAFGPGVIMRNQ